jgi:putative pyruvate formate lyase activating enzyme
MSNNNALMQAAYKQAYSDCRLCPRNCGVNRLACKPLASKRLAGKLGYCKESSQLRIASASLHWGEEPPITGKGGSGTIFITGCNLGCLFCQNWDISISGRGRSISEKELVETFLNLQKTGAENINLVTPTHAAPALLNGITTARKKGLSIPVLWNSAAYESVETLSMLEGNIDIWLPDLKTLDSSISDKYFNAPDYPETAEKAILYMLKHSELRLNHRGVILSGVVIRHLALPGHLDASREVLQWFAKHARNRALLSLLTQYTPNHRVYSKNCPSRYISREETETLRSWVKEFKIENGFFQGRSLNLI